MPMSSSPYLNNWRRSRCATSDSFMHCCFAQLPRPYWRSPPIHATSVRASACLLFSIRGVTTSSIILICTVSFPPADLPSITPAGLQPGDEASSFQSAYSAACSAASCLPSSSRAIGEASYASPASWLNFQQHTLFTLCLVLCAEKNGWSIPSLHSEDPNMC